MREISLLIAHAPYRRGRIFVPLFDLERMRVKCQVVLKGLNGAVGIRQVSLSTDCGLRFEYREPSVPDLYTTARVFIGSEIVIAFDHVYGPRMPGQCRSEVVLPRHAPLRGFGGLLTEKDLPTLQLGPMLHMIEI